MYQRRNHHNQQQPQEWPMECKYEVPDTAHESEFEKERQYYANQRFIYGIDEIVEVKCYGASTLRGVAPRLVKFYCRVCAKTLTTSAVVRHCASYLHLFGYLRMKFPNEFTRIETIDSVDMQLKFVLAVLQKLDKRLHTSEAAKKPAVRIYISEEALEREFHQYQYEHMNGGGWTPLEQIRHHDSLVELNELDEQRTSEERTRALRQHEKAYRSPNHFFDTLIEQQDELSDLPGPSSSQNDKKNNIDEQTAPPSDWQYEKPRSEKRQHMSIAERFERPKVCGSEKNQRQPLSKRPCYNQEVDADVIAVEQPNPESSLIELSDDEDNEVMVTEPETFADFNPMEESKRQFLSRLRTKINQIVSDNVRLEEPLANIIMQYMDAEKIQLVESHIDEDELNNPDIIYLEQEHMMALSELLG